MGRRAQHGWPAAVLAAYAASIGKNVRTAQRHANEGHPDFLRFAQGQAGENIARQSGQISVPPVTADAAALMPPEMPPEVATPDDQLSETGLMLKMAWTMWKSHAEQWRVARGGWMQKDGKPAPTEHAMMLCHAKIIIDLRKAYNDAALKHQQWLVDNRRLIPVNEFEQFRAEFLLPLTSLMRNMPAEAAPLMNPQNQALAIRGGNDWLQQRFMPQVNRLIERLSAFAPQLTAA